MAFSFHKNAILTGYIDSYCLVCDNYLKTEDDILIHIVKPIHKKNLDSCVYLEKYKNEHIRKVKKGYYCEVCNLLLKTATKVSLHIAETKHIDNRKSQILKRTEKAVVAFEDLIISEISWNGLSENTCAICNTEFDNQLIHKTETNHVIGLVQSKLEVDSEKNLYRKVDDTTFHCLTCNVVDSIDLINFHFISPDHKKMYLECQENYAVHCSEADSSSISNQIKGEEADSSSISNQIKEIPNGSGNKFEDKIKETESINVAKTVIKQATVNVGTSNKIDEKIKTQQENKVLDSRKNINTNSLPKHANAANVDDSESYICKVLGAKNYITQDGDGKNWCILCDWSMDNIAIDMHVKSLHHQTILKMHKDRINKLKSSEVKVEIDDKIEKIEEKEQSHDKLLESISEFQKNDININFVSNTAFCKKCSVNIPFEYEAIENHIKNHKQAPNKTETKAKPFPSSARKYNKSDGNTSKNFLFTSPVVKTNNTEKISEINEATNVSASEFEEEIEKFGKENQLKYDRENRIVYCIVCDSKVPSSLRSMKEHVAGTAHKNRISKGSKPTPSALVVAKPPTIVRQATCDFIESLTGIENIFRKDIIINDKFCIGVLSFCTITKNDFRLRCHVCDTTIDSIDIHIKTSNHEAKINDLPILISFESEFIREIPPGLFHCGYCNQIEGNWQDLESHLKSTAHKESKTSANWRLQECMSEIQEQRRNRAMQDHINMIHLMRMMNTNPFF